MSELLVDGQKPELNNQPFRKAHIQVFGYLLSANSGLLIGMILAFTVSTIVMAQSVQSNDPNAMCFACLGGCVVATFGSICFVINAMLVLTIGILALVFWLTTGTRNQALPVFSILGLIISGIITFVVGIFLSGDQYGESVSQFGRLMFQLSQMLTYLFLVPMAFWIGGWQHSVGRYGMRNLEWLVCGLVGLAYSLLIVGTISGYQADIESGSLLIFSVVTFAIGALVYSAAMFVLGLACFKFARLV